MHTYRWSRGQRRRLNRAAALAIGGVSAVQLGLGLIVDQLGPALVRAVVLVAAGLFAMLTVRFSATVLDEVGIRTRTFGLFRRACPWACVAAIDVRRSQGGASVRVTRTDGTRFSLGAPMVGRAIPDPLFEVSVAEIRTTWLAHVDGTPPLLGSPRTRVLRRIGLAVDGIVLWLVAPLVLFAAVLNVHDDWAFTDVGHVRAVVTDVDTSRAFPIYRLEATQGSTFPAASEAVVSPAEAFCALMDGRTRVGDTVELVYPRSDPDQLQDERVAPDVLEDFVPAGVGGGVLLTGAVIARRLLTRTRRLHRR